VRAFDTTMPAFGEAFSEDEIQAILNYVRTFCNDTRWPRGELNLPRALFTEKAFPEDEAVLEFRSDTESPRSSGAALVYEKRFGPRSQIEIELPFVFGAVSGDVVTSGLGDAAIALKHNIWHSLARGGILSLGTEVVLPTGDRDSGLGSGTFIIEPFVSYGQMLPRDAFFQLQALVELPTDTECADSEFAVRGVLGRTWAAGDMGFGRAWTPMLETIASRDIDGGSITLDLVPQLQVTLNTRQHVIANFGVRVPVTNTELRRTELVLYVLWDWFDGGLFDGW
jgi:hypothetical protein